jgi:hypothetical protein
MDQKLHDLPGDFISGSVLKYHIDPTRDDIISTVDSVGAMLRPRIAAERRLGRVNCLPSNECNRNTRQTSGETVLDLGGGRISGERLHSDGDSFRSSLDREKATS